MISIVVPYYKTKEYVKECLDSIKNQTYKNYEVLFIDDGSNEDIDIYLKDYFKNSRFKYYKIKHSGLSIARNTGISIANGEYICFIDSDDYIEKDYLELLYKSIIDNNSIYSFCLYDREYYISTKKEYILNNLDPQCWLKLIDRKYLIDNNIYFENIAYEDVLFSARLYISTGKYSYVEKPLYHYRQRDNSLISINDNIYNIFEVLDILKNYISDKHYDYYIFNFLIHGVIASIYRLSFTKEFNINNIKYIYNRLLKENNKWYKNKYIKELSIKYKIFILLLKYKLFLLIFILLKIFNEKIKK